MAITSLTYSIQGSGTDRRIIFTATPHVGPSFEFIINTSDPTFDPETRLAGLTQKLETKLGQDEVDRWMADTNAPVTTIHATKAQYAAAIRQAYRDATKEESWRLAYKIYSRYQAGDFTAAQLAAAFGITVGKLNTFATNVLIPAHNNWLLLQAAEGE